MEANRQTSSEALWSALIAFALLAVLGPLLGWSTGDLLWGLVLTSLVTSVIAAVLGLVSIGRLGWRKVSMQPRPERLRFLFQAPFLALFGAILIAMVYGFHHFYAFFIYFLFPLWPEAENAFDLSQEQQQQLLREAAARYWPFVIAALASDWRQLLRPLWDPQLTDLFRPWAMLVRMHLFIFVAVAVLLVAGTGYPFYLLILLFLFFPWRLTWRQLSARRGIRPASHRRDKHGQQ